MDIHEMRAEKNKLWNKMKEFLTEKMKDGKFLSDTDAAEYGAMEKDMDGICENIRRMEALDRIGAELNQPIGTPPLNQPAGGKLLTGRAGPAYHKALMTCLRSNFRTVSDDMREGADADGGYLVSAEMDSRLITALTNENIMRGLATVIQTRREHKIPVAGTSSAAAWVDEGQALSFGSASFDQIILDAHKLHAAIKVSEELLYDSDFDLGQYLTARLGAALGAAEEEAFMVGDGSGKPTGIFDTAGGGAVAMTAALTAESVIGLVYAVGRPYRKNGAFILNDKNLAEIRKMKDGAGAFIWQPAYASGEPDKLMGYPVYVSPSAPESAIAFGDFSYYNIGDRGTRSIAELRELFAGNGMVGFVGKERVDGKLVLKEAVKILKISG